MCSHLGLPLLLLLHLGLVAGQCTGCACGYQQGSPWVHDGVDIDLFRAVPATGSAPVAGQVSTVGFTLEYMDHFGTGTWTALRWDQLEVYHGSKVHVNVMSSDGDDFYHVHPEYTGFAVTDEQTDLGVDVTLLQAGTHLVTVTWVVEVSALGLCTIENIKHAHGLSSNALLYPLLMESWTIDVADSAAAATDKLPPAERLLSAADATLSCGKPATVHGEHHTYNHSYELAESVTCCCSAGSAAHLDTHAANCAGRCAAGAGCLRVDATAVSLDEVPGAPATYVTTVDGQTYYPSATCMYVTLDVADAAGDGGALSLNPYLGAAAGGHVPSTRAKDRAPRPS